ncbi:MAG: DNA polymerase III subunit gamma/tau [Armatimonadetes bacterium]|nr:DNA polymerase III subunit gamma/tau [Armatimonadota bacterium]
MAYVSLYRKYRSQTFEEVMGQEHITRTLQNAIKLGKIGHAYLFCGTRGTGKTTTARLLAKALNCEKGPTPNPCNECAACKSINEGTAIDIIEMDAASNRGVDDVAKIRENVKFPPMALRYKVFIIDEAHQLSGDAKDAFLKTLEEPPSYVIFVLATTEPHKIPITIRSRCQQFDFRRGSIADIRARLAYVANSEGIKAEDAALDLIALNADGSWRDGLSLMEQVLAYTDGELRVDDVYKVLGTVTQDFLFRMADVIAEGDEPGAFEMAAEAVASGKDLRQLLRSLAEHFRNLLFASVTKDQYVLGTSKEASERLAQQAAKFKKAELINLVETFLEAEREARLSDQHRLITEMAFLKAIRIANPQQAKIAVPASAPSEPSQTTSQPDRREKPTSTQPEIRQARPASSAKQATDEKKIPEFDTILEKWNQVLQHVRSISLPAHVLFSESKPAAIRGNALVLHFKHEGHCVLIMNEKEKPDTPSKRRAFQMAFERVFGTPNIPIICETASEQAAPRRTIPKPEEEEDLPDPFQEPAAATDDNETLRSVLDMFEGELVDD